MTWHAIKIGSTRHAISAEFSDAGYDWGVSELKNPVTLVGVIACGSKEEAKRIARELNRG